MDACTQEVRVSLQRAYQYAYGFEKVFCVPERIGSIMVRYSFAGVFEFVVVNIEECGIYLWLWKLFVLYGTNIFGMEGTKFVLG